MYSISKALLLTVISSIFAVPVYANGTASLKNHPFQESYLDQVPVSGRVIVGVSAATEESSVYPLAMLPPLSAAGNSVCVQVMSRDGRYSSQNIFSLPKDFGPQPISLEYPSQYSDYLKQLKAQELAVLVFPGACGEGSGNDTFFLSTEPGSIKKPDLINIYVNSGRSDSFIKVINDKGGLPVQPCKIIEIERRTGFDTICPIHISEIETNSERLSVKIFRRQYERTLPATELFIEVPKKLIENADL